VWLHCLLPAVPVCGSACATACFSACHQAAEAQEAVAGAEHGSAPDTADLAQLLEYLWKEHIGHCTPHTYRCSIWQHSNQYGLQTSTRQTVMCLLQLCIFSIFQFQIGCFLSGMQHLVLCMRSSCCEGWSLILCGFVCWSGCCDSRQGDEDHDSTMGAPGTLDLQQLDMSVDLDECEGLEAGLTQVGRSMLCCIAGFPSSCRTLHKPYDKAPIPLWLSLFSLCLQQSSNDVIARNASKLWLPSQRLFLAAAGAIELSRAGLPEQLEAAVASTSTGCSPAEVHYAPEWAGENRAP